MRNAKVVVIRIFKVLQTDTALMTGYAGKPVFGQVGFWLPRD
jgi:hypothetical protein